MKKMATRVGAVLLLAITVLVTMSGCNSNASKDKAEFNSSGYLVGPAGESCTIDSATGRVIYTILTEDEYDKEELDSNVNKTLEKVKKWWGNDETFVEPKIVPVKFSTEVRGFADDGYIFIEPLAEDAMVTVCHETIHIQNQNGLMYEDETGREIMEMYVEFETMEIMNKEFIEQATDNYKFFISCPKLYKNRGKLNQAFKQNKSAREVYTQIFGDNAKEIVKKLDYWRELPNILSLTELKSFSPKYLGISDTELLEMYDFS